VFLERLLIVKRELDLFRIVAPQFEGHHLVLEIGPLAAIDAHIGLFTVVVANGDVDVGVHAPEELRVPRQSRPLKLYYNLADHHFLL